MIYAGPARRLGRRGGQPLASPDLACSASQAGSGLVIMSCRQSLPWDPVVTEVLSPTAG